MSYGLIIVLRFSIILSGQDFNRKTTILDGERRVSSKGLLCGGRPLGTSPGDVPIGTAAILSAAGAVPRRSQWAAHLKKTA